MKTPCILRALATLAATWSCLSTVSAQVVISEIHYHPVEEPAFDSISTYNPTLDLTDDVHEFVEIQNTSVSPVDVSGWTLSGAVDFTFPASTSIAAGGFKVVAKNVSRLQTVYSISGVLGPYTGKLSNSGDTVRLKNVADVTVDSASYSSDFPWAQSANALGAQDRFTGLTSSTYQYKGRSLQRVSATAGSNDPANWLASPLSGPTPGAAQAITRVVPKPVVVAKSHIQASDGATVILPSQAVTVNCTFSSTASLSAVQLEWFVDLADSSAEAHTTTTMTHLGSGAYTASITGQAARSVVRYRIKANRGDGAEIVSPRSDDPAISAVGASNAVEPWHGYFVNPTGRSATNPNYDLFLSTTNLTTIRSYAQQGGQSSNTTRRVTAATAAGLPRSLPWVAAGQPLWDGTVPATFAYNGELYDVHIRFHGSRYHRYGNATDLLSFKLYFPETHPFQTKTSWFITSHLQVFHEATVLNRLAGLPASKAQFVSWYLNANAVATRLQQGEYDGDMLDDYHNSMHDRVPGSMKEDTGFLYKDVGNRDTSANNVEGPYTCGDMVAIAANGSWTKYQRYEWTYSNQNRAWIGPKPFATMLEGMWTARGDSTATHNFSGNATQLANTKAWFNANFDMETTLTSMALVEWMSIWDDAKQNQFYWLRANGKWSRLGWDYDGVMSTEAAGIGGTYNQSITAGEFGSTIFDGVNWWKDTFYKCFLTEYKNRLWQINNSFCDPANLLAMGFTNTSKCYLFAQLRQANVNTQLGLGTYYKPARPTNSTPSTGSAVLSGASLKSSAYSHPNAKTHLSTKWEIRSSTGNYEEPVYAVTSTTAKSTLAIPYDSLTFGETYYWRVTYNDADSHASVISAETSFTWGIANAVAGDLKLNEILADNKVTIANDGTYPDYIELRNNGSSPYNLTGVTLTDDVAVPAKYTFPSGNTIPAGGHLIVWCDKEPTASGIHTGFALSSGGQTVLLMSGTSVLDNIAYGPQAPDLSIGRIINGTGSWTATTPTPGAANTAATLGTTSTLKVNEWMASPAYDDDWFELYNSGSSPVALAGLYLSDTPTTPTKTQIPALSFIAAGGYTKFLADDSTAATAGANHCNFSLKAGGESVVLTASNGTTTLNFFTFPSQSSDVSQGRMPDGGSGISSFTTTASPEKPNWLAAPVQINEALSNPLEGSEDSIELINTTAAPVSVANWWLSDDVMFPKKFQIPAGTTIPANGFVVFTATHFAAGTVPFALSSDGDECCLSAVDGSLLLTGYRSQMSLGNAAPDVTFGRVAATGLANGKGGYEFWPQSSATLGIANGSPVVTPVILNEIMYHPTDGAGGAGGADVTVSEFIELHNPSNSAVDLSGWRLKGDSSFTFPSGATLPAFGYALIVGFDPATDATSLTAFNSAYGLSGSAAMYGPFEPKLANNTHGIELAKPVVAGATTLYVNVDKCVYRDVSPWPIAIAGNLGVDGGGKSLQRVARDIIGNTAANWLGATPTPRALNSGLYTSLAVWSQSPAPAGVTGSAYSFPLVGVGGTPAYTWSLDSGSLPNNLFLTAGAITGNPSLAGTFNFTIRLTDSASSFATKAFSITITTTNPDTDSDGIPDAWETANGLIVGVNDAADDNDGDGQSNIAEYLSGTDPQSASSVFRISAMTAPAAGGVQITWPAVAGKTYQIWTSTDLTNWSFYQSVIAASTGNQVLPVTTGGVPKLYVRVTTGP